MTLKVDRINEFGNGDLFNYRNDTERHAVNQRFSELKKQICDLTNLVLALTEKISFSNREGNELNTVTNGHETRSDTVHKIDIKFSLKFSPESARACANASKLYE